MVAAVVSLTATVVYGVIQITLAIGHWLRRVGAGGVADQGAGVHVVQPPGVPHGPLPLGPLRGKLADATGYPFRLSSCPAAGLTPTGDLGPCPLRARSRGNSRGTTGSGGQKLTGRTFARRYSGHAIRSGTVRLLVP